MRADEYKVMHVEWDIAMQAHDCDSKLAQRIDTGMFELPDVTSAQRRSKAFWSLEQRIALHNTLYSQRPRPCFPEFSQQRVVMERPDLIHADFSLLGRVYEELSSDEQWSKSHLSYVHLLCACVRPDWQMIDLYRWHTAYNMGAFLVTMQQQDTIAFDVYASCASFYRLIQQDVSSAYHWGQKTENEFDSFGKPTEASLVGAKLIGKYDR